MAKCWEYFGRGERTAIHSARPEASDILIRASPGTPQMTNRVEIIRLQRQAVHIARFVRVARVDADMLRKSKSPSK